MNISKNFVRGLLFFATFCLFINLAQSSDSFENSNSIELKNTISKVRQEIQNDVKKMRAAYNEETKVLRQQSSTLSKELQNFSEMLQVVLNQNSELKNRISELERENNRIKDNLGSHLKKLELLIGEEENARIEADQNIVKEVFAGISQVASRVETSPSLAMSQNQGSSSTTIYQVVKGDTLGAISMAFGVSLKKLMALNNLNETTIFVGQKIKIPEN